jgi:hypothetical protein
MYVGFFCATDAFLNDASAKSCVWLEDYESSQYQFYFCKCSVIAQVFIYCILPKEQPSLFIFSILVCFSGSNVQVPAEVIVLNSIVLPHKDLSGCYKNQIIL